ncbi:PilN domain-containing protein [Pseudoroseomonas sp. WGS1072]|uniref:PilN domain-containing protein n=1 Tax=Roseomonas sp. WGS1072 TaxID=3366816 RepID=UPI003BF31533
MSLRETVGRARRGAEAFLRWWGAELRDMLPPRWRGRRRRLVVDLRGAAPGLARLQGGRVQPLGPLAGRAPAALGRARRLILLVPPAWVLRRVLTLPAAAEARLGEVLDFEIEQHVPFAAAEVLWDARVLRRLAEAQRIEVEVAVLPRAAIAEAARAARGRAAHAVLEARGDPAAPWPAIPLDGLAPPARRWRGPLEAGLAAAVPLLALYLGLAALWAGEERVLAAEAEAVAARRGAERILALEAGNQALRERLSAAAALRGGRPAAVAVLEQVAALLPDDAWLTEFRLAGDQLLLTGFAARSDALLGQLDAAPGFRNPRFAAPVTRGPRDPADRFQVALTLVAPERAVAAEAPLTGPARLAESRP